MMSMALKWHINVNKCILKTLKSSAVGLHLHLICEKQQVLSRKEFFTFFQTRDGNPIELRLLRQLLIYSSDTSSDAPTNISIIGPIWCKLFPPFIKKGNENNLSISLQEETQQSVIIINYHNWIRLRWEQL